MAQHSMRRFCLLEEHDSVRSVIQDSLQGLGCRLLSDSADSVAQTEADLYLLSVSSLPKAVFFSLLQEIRQSFPNAMVVATGFPVDAQLLHRALEEGAASILFKPIVPAKLLVTVFPSPPQELFTLLEE